MELVDRAPDPAIDVDVQESWESFCKTLPVLYREVVRLLSLGHTEAQVAQSLGISAKQVSQIVVRVCALGRQ